jgi:hypothetical protein
VLAYLQQRQQEGAALENAKHAEDKSIQTIFDIVTRSVEALYILHLLAQPQSHFPRLVCRLPPQTQLHLADLTFHSLVTTSNGSALIKKLVSALLEDAATTAGGSEKLNDSLGRQCPG